MNSTKKCTGCGRELPLTEFNKKREAKGEKPYGRSA